jgi:hypothetical protein
VRQLEVVAISDDGTHVLLAAGRDSRPTHQLRVDERLVAAVKGDLDVAERSASELSPKEIQARLRAGETPEQVAKAAKVAVGRVNRYAGPVMSERERILDQARATPMRRSRGPAMTTPLGEAVGRRLAALSGLRADSVEWSASRREDGAWAVTLSYNARGHRSASWLWHPAEHELTALDPAAGRLAADEPARRPTSTRAATSRSARTQPARTTPKRRSRPQPSATRERDQAPVRRRTLAADSAAAAAAATGPSEPDVAATTADRAGKRNGRVQVPSWSDVLLGVQAPEMPAAKPPRPKPRASSGTRRRSSGSAAGGRRHS